jgi:SAM-dependent methyltransferase
MKRKTGYIHGYTGQEKSRLHDQAQTLADLLHHDTLYGAGEKILEVGCGTGAQTVILAANSPHAGFTSIDLSAVSVKRAREKARRLAVTNVEFRVADVYRLPFQDHSFDHGFVCFLLEHLNNPQGALEELMRVIQPGGTLTVVEGDHGSAYFYPECQESQSAIEALISLQADLGGNALIGRRLHPILCSAGLEDVIVSPRMVYVDRTKPHLVRGFIRDTFTAMIQGVRETAISRGLFSADAWEKGIQGLLRTMEPDGVFCYTFFKAVGVNPRR